MTSIINPLTFSTNSMKKISKISKVAFVLFTLAYSVSAMAAGPGVPPPGLPDNSGVPLEGGIAALLIGAAAYGIKKLRDNRKA